MQQLIDILTNIVNRGHFSTEAPASINVKLNYRGYDAMITFRGENGVDALQRMDAAINYLEGQEGTNPQTQPQSQPAQVSNGASDDEAPMCNLHNRPMKVSQYGGWYCTAKLGDGTYCKEKIKP